YAGAMGCPEVPMIDKMVVGKMGLRGTPGLNVGIVQKAPHAGRGGGGGRGGNGGGPRGPREVPNGGASNGGPGANGGAGGRRGGRQGGQRKKQPV
ncbi:hypothetical protein LTR33_014288, partial [Friedmanniomyces endolithicus]